MVILCTIDLETREVSLPAGQVIASYDHNVDVIRFQAEAIPGFSLDTSSIKIAAQGPNKSRHDYAVDPSTVQIEEETGYITFDWPIPAGVTEMPIGTFKYGDKGQLIFAVCAEIIDGSTVSKAWHSDDGIITVVAHLEPEAGGGEDPSEEATNAQKIGQLQTDVAVVQRKVAAAAGGTPTVVDAKADMTEHDKIYILSSDGKWYYYSETASDWLVGGTYGGAVTSTTFTEHGVPADDFAVGEALADKADADDLTAVQTALESKADADDVTELDTRATAVEGDVSDLKKDLNATINGYECFYDELSVNSGVGQDWNHSYEKTIPAGTEVEVLFNGYSGTDFTRFLISGVKSDDTSVNLKSFTVNESSKYSFVAEYDFKKLNFQLRRSHNQQSVNMSWGVKANIGTMLGHDYFETKSDIKAINIGLPVVADDVKYSLVDRAYILRDGVVRDSANFFMTSLIKIDAGKSLYVKSQMPNSNQYGIVTRWTSEDVYIDWIFSPANSNVNTFYFTATEDTYVKLCGYSGYVFDFMIYGVNDGGITVITNEVANQLSDDKSLYPLKGLKWDVMGDSLTNHDSVGNSGRNYVQWIADGNGIDANNIGRGGKDWWNGFLAEVPNIRSTADIVTIFGSFNEISSVVARIGNLTDTPSASGSFCARVKNIFNSIYAVKNDIKIGVILPTPWVNINPYDTDATTMTGINEFLDTLTALCKMYSIPVLDLFHTSMMRPWDETFRNAYYRQEVVDGVTRGDGVHPNTNGHRYYVAPRIEAFLKTLVRGY